MLLRGSGISGGKFRIYEQFLKQESTEKNAAFLKEEYGTGGAYPAIPDRKLDEWHDPKGIRISVGSAMQPDAQLTLSWGEAAKRIGELINADRYLNRAEKEHYPVYRAHEEQRKARWEIAKEIRSIIDDYVDFKTQLGEKEKCAEVLSARGCADSFGMGEKKCYALTSKGSFVLPTLRDAMQTIIGDNTHLTERCEALLTQLSGPLAAPLEPTADETNPPPPPKKEYRFSLGDTVYLGTQEYSLIAFDEKTVRLYDPTFPLLNKEMERAEFDRMLAENPLNDPLAYIVEDVPVPAGTERSEEPAPRQENDALAEAKRLIRAYCQEEFGRDADYSDLSHVDLAYTTTSDSDLPIEISADLMHFRLVSQVNGQDVVTLQCHDLDDLNQYLASLDFDEMTAYAEEQYQKEQGRDNSPEQPQESGQKMPTLPESSRVDEMLRQAELANRLYEKTGQTVFGFEAGKSQPVNLPQPSAPVIQPGIELTLDERCFVVDSVDEAAGTVSLRDTTFQNGTGFPIFRSEAIETVRRALAEAEKEPEPIQLRSVVIDLTPRSDREPEKQPGKEPGPSAPPLPRPREKLPPLLLHPEIPSDRRHNYHITDEHLGEGGEKTKF